MPSLEDYAQKFHSLSEQFKQDRNAYTSRIRQWTLESFDGESRQLFRIIAHHNKELTFLKREVNLTIQELSKAYATKRVAIGKTAGWGVARGLFGRKAIGALSMAKRNDLTAQKDRALRPYRVVAQSIDNTILLTDRYKIDLEAALMKVKEALGST